MHALGELGDERALVGGPHERLADQHGMHAFARVAGDVLAALDPAEGGEQDTALERRLREVRCGAHVDVKAVQVAVVYPDHLRAQLEGTGHLLGIVHLHERLHAEPHAVLVERAERRVIEHRDDQQHRVGAREPRLGNLVHVQDKVLEQDRGTLRQVCDRLAGERQVREGALEPVWLGEHAHHAGAATGIGERLDAGVRVRVDVALAGARALHLGHERHGPRATRALATREALGKVDLRRIEVQREARLEVRE